MTIDSNVLPKGHLLKSPNYSYRIEKVLGCGGFGITYLASANIKVGNVSVKAKFAIKEHFMSSDCERDQDSSRVVYSNPAKDRVENSRKDFIAEANRLHKIGIDHPNIVKVNEVFEANNTAYYVMEYLEGESLRTLVKKEGPLPEERMWALMNPIIDAVKTLHTGMMTHLDIKPDNIMVTHDENGDLRPVLIDFGLSKHYDQNGQPTSTINTLGCSDGYAPIEQYAGITTFSPTADYYALGATMWFCLTAKDPKKATELKNHELAGSIRNASVKVSQFIDSACDMNRDNRNLNYDGPTVKTPPPYFKPSADLSALYRDSLQNKTSVINKSGSNKYLLIPISRNAGIGFYIAALLLLLLPFLGVTESHPLRWIWYNHSFFGFIGIMGTFLLSCYGFVNPKKFVESSYLKYLWAGSVCIGTFMIFIHDRTLYVFIAYMIFIAFYEIIVRLLPKLTQIGFLIAIALSAIIYLFF